jgi:antitoxin component YwqK of YwqJK toxin-antitoxin module
MQPLNGVVVGESQTTKGKEEISYDNGKIILSKVWYSNGKLFNKTTYDEYEQPEGEYKQWHSNGQLWHYKFKTITKPKECLDLEEYLDFGINSSWYMNGALDTETLYYNDRSCGISNYEISKKQWYNNGQLRMHLNFNDFTSDGNGQKYRTNKWWYENGNLETEVHIAYLKYNSDGLWKSWDKNGKLEYEGSFKEGKNLGLFKKWDLNGDWNPLSSICEEFPL